MPHSIEELINFLILFVISLAIFKGLRLYSVECEDD
jgi:hypothetical protein